MRLHSACVRVSSCVILMSEGLVKSMWTGLPPGVDGALELLSGGVLGPGDGTDGADNSREDLDEESDWRDITMFLLYSGYVV